jgi:protein O-mannosyl-transferase
MPNNFMESSSPQSTRPAEESRSVPGFGVMAVVAAAASLVFVEAVTFGFVYDDVGQILENQHILSWSSTPEYFTRPVALNFYRPLFMTWLLLNRILFGLDPAFWHSSSILLHALNSVLVFMLGTKLLTRAGALVAALLFAVHPAHIEPVAWVSGVTEPLTAVFVLGCLLAYIRSQESPARWWWLASLVLAAAAMLSKETGIAVVLLIFAYAAMHGEQPMNARLLRALRESVAYAGVAALFLGARYVVLGGFARPVLTLSTAEMVWTWPSVIMFYVKTLLWPFRLAVYYEMPAVASPLQERFILPLLMLTAVSATLIGLCRRTRDRVLVFAIVWIAGTMLPVLYLRAFGMNDYVHDRYLYLPSVGFVLLVARFWEVWHQRSMWASAALCLAGLLFAGSLLAQVPHWRTDWSLFNRAYQISPKSEYVLNNLAVELEKRGEYDRALELYRSAIQVNPSHALAQYNLGLLLYRTGDLPEADRHFAAAQALNPRHTPTLANRGLVKMHTGDFVSAEALMRKAIALQPGNPHYQFNLGQILERRGETRAAQQVYETVLRMDPDHAQARNALQTMSKK